MEHRPDDNSLKAKVLSAIESGKVRMRPRWHFVLKAALLAVSALFLIVAATYLASFVVFVMRQDGSWYVSCFGAAGLRAFLTAVPWVLVLLAVVLLALLETLVRRFSFAYRRPLVASVAVIMAFVAVAGLAVARTRLHPALFRHMRERHVPFGEPFYRAYVGREMEDVHPGLVEEFLEGGFRLRTVRGRVPVLVTPSTRFVPDARLMLGDGVIVFGPLMEGRIHAFGVRKVPRLPELPRP